MACKISGHILDRNNRPLPKTSVLHQGKVVATANDHGFFEATLKVKPPRVALTFSANGCVDNTQVFKVTAAGNGNVIVVWPIAHRVVFDARQALDIQLDGSQIRLPANALVDHKQKNFSGNAHLQYTLFDVTDPRQRAAASGDFSGKMLDGSTSRLNSFGIFELDIRDSKGRPLKLRPGISIDVSIPVHRKLLERAPKTVGYFDLDKASGYWVEVGNFQLYPATGVYNGSVTSFGGVHNCDTTQDTVCVTVRIVRIDDSMPIANANVTANGLQYSSTGTTDLNGYVCLLVQRNAQFSVSAWADDGSSHYTTINQTNFTSPDFSSGAGDCGNPETCPFLGVHPVNLAVG